MPLSSQFNKQHFSVLADTKAEKAQVNDINRGSLDLLSLQAGGEHVQYQSPGAVSLKQNVAIINLLVSNLFFFFFSSWTSDNISCGKFLL